MRDMSNNVTPKPVLAPAVGTDDTALVGAIIDRLGYDSLTYLIQTGVLADAAATWTVLLEESDDSGMAGAGAVPDGDLIGTEALAGFNQAADGKCLKLGYVGNKRYTRLTVTPAGNAGSAPISAMALLGNPYQRPTANPPA
jgi:hypothetical protein